MRKLLFINFEKYDGNFDTLFDLRRSRRWLRDHDLLHKVVYHDFVGTGLTYYFDWIEHLLGEPEVSAYPDPGVCARYRKDEAEILYDKMRDIDNKEDLDSFYEQLNS